MPKVGTATYAHTNKAGVSRRETVVIHVTGAGLFYADVETEWGLAAVAMGLVSRVSRGSRGIGTKDGTIRISAPLRLDLDTALAQALKVVMEPEIRETPVIRFNIASHVMFAIDAQGQVAPNAGFPGFAWPRGDAGKLFGDHHARDPSSGGYSLTIGAMACLKTVTRFGESERVSYARYYAGGSPHGRSNPAELLNAWTSFHLPASAREIPYSDEAALFFHRLMMNMAELNLRIQNATFDIDRLQALIAGGHLAGGLALLPPTRPDEEV